MKHVAPEHRQNTTNDDRSEQSLYTLSGNGIYVSGHINNRPTSILLDTGATTSVISEETWKKVGNITQRDSKMFTRLLKQRMENI